MFRLRASSAREIPVWMLIDRIQNGSLVNGTDMSGINRLFHTFPRSGEWEDESIVIGLHPMTKF